LQGVDISRKDPGRGIPAEILQAAPQLRDRLLGRVRPRACIGSAGGGFLAVLVERGQCNAERFHGVVGCRKAL
jgi:hypothetical protein